LFRFFSQQFPPENRFKVAAKVVNPAKQRYNIH